MNSKYRFLEYISYNNSIYGLLLLYPLFSTVVRHWNSILIGFILLIGLIYFFFRKNKDNVVLHEYERVFLWILAGNFFVFLLTSLIHLPEDTREIRFDIELRFLLVIPLYFLLIKSRHGFRYLAIGAVSSVLIASAFAFHEIVIESEAVFAGVYSHLYTGPINLIYLCLATGFLYWMADLKPATRWVLLLSVVFAGLFIIIYSYSRVTYVSLLAVVILFAIFMMKGWLRIVAIFMLFSITVYAGFISPQVNSRMTAAYDELKEYVSLSGTDERVNAEITTSVGTRLEMWRAAPLVLRDHLLVGVGNGNYNKAMQVYIENKELNPVVGRHSHAHNVFVNVLIVKGLLGLVITCLVLFYPLYIYIRTYKQSRHTAAIGIIFMTIIFLYSLNETAPFVKSNFVATFLLISVVIYQNHIWRIKELNND